MLVAASSECFPELSLDAALQRLVDLEYSHVEIEIREQGNQLKPADVLADIENAVQQCRETHRLRPVAYTFESTAPEPLYYEQFTACCKLAKLTKVAVMTVPSSELGTPFNAEVERLRELVKIGAKELVVVGIKSQIGRISQDPDTAIVLCDNVKGLGVTLDPTHYLCGPHGVVNYDHLMKYVCHTQLRDSTKDKQQVRVGQGSIEYGRLVTQLARVHYQRALSVHITPASDVDHSVEMRKMRMLLESLL